MNENDVVANGDADANYIDHIPFWETDVAQRDITSLTIAANVFVVATELEDDPRVVAVAKALQSPEITTWITEEYDGAVIPVHPASR